jgi:hypothetical protein
MIQRKVIKKIAIFFKDILVIIKVRRRINSRMKKVVLVKYRRPSTEPMPIYFRLLVLIFINKKQRIINKLVAIGSPNPE